MEKVTLESVNMNLMDLKREMFEIKIILEEGFELADDVLEDIKESKKRPLNEFVSHKEMINEFG